MTSSSNTIEKIDTQILRSNESICRHIANHKFIGRGCASQDIINYLRTFVEHIMFKIYAGKHNTTYSYEGICQGIKFAKSQGKLQFLNKFHKFLQIIMSHYTLDPEDSERAMLKYLEYLIKIKKFMHVTYRIEILENLHKFPLNIDNNLQEYYEKIAKEVLVNNTTPKSYDRERYYIHKTKPFFVNGNIFYEVTFTPAVNKASKFDRMLAFTSLDISRNYATRLRLSKANIKIFDKAIPILIINECQTSIRPVEIERFSNLFGESLQNYAGNAEYRGLMDFLTKTGFNLLELITFPQSTYQNYKEKILSKYNSKSQKLFSLFDRSREIILQGKSGESILRYLLYSMKNEVLKNQLGDCNYKLSNLNLQFGCIPFEQMPFCSSLLGHNPKIRDLFQCIEHNNREHELLARYVTINTEQYGKMYTPESELENFNDIPELIKTFNSKLYNNERHQNRKLLVINNNVYIHGYELSTLKIINELKDLSNECIENYTRYIQNWLDTVNHNIDCEEKKNILLRLFDESAVAVIYGSAGTGKSTLINHISQVYSRQSRLYLANTNPAVENMKRKITYVNNDTDFMTIAKFLKRHNNRTKYDFLFIDECSTVSNSDMVEVIQKAEFNFLILVGDTYQIESIRFGNWFSVVKSFLPDSSICELTKPYRSNSENLQILWNRVRNLEDTILESIVKNKYSTKLDSSIFEYSGEDEILLCLNYDGLYGINNINCLLQESNPNQAFSWGLLQYKVNDPVLFNDSERFAPAIHNNVKGWIKNIEKFDEKIQFDIEIEKLVNGFDANDSGFELLNVADNGNSLVRFCVYLTEIIDDNTESSEHSLVPFQISYAVSIHKAQGLEYNSVKIIITDEVEERITHNIFYTAITRARQKLKIYWSPEVENKIITSLKSKNNVKDVALLKNRINVES